ncbi:MAG: hypothetical protein KIT69_05790 [Propionibacteriaceae bacterium]|nr:hypothetical protein [Propionibacteriaceae bacterium]
MAVSTVEDMISFSFIDHIGNQHDSFIIKRENSVDSNLNTFSGIQFNCIWIKELNKKNTFWPLNCSNIGSNNTEKLTTLKDYVLLPGSIKIFYVVKNETMFVELALNGISEEDYFKLKSWLSDYKDKNGLNTRLKPMAFDQSVKASDFTPKPRSGNY